MQNEHSAILSTFIKLQFAIKTFVLSIFEWPLKTGFTEAELDIFSEMVPKEESHKIHLHTTDDTLKVNLEHVCSNLQKELIEQLGPFLKETAHNDQIPNVSFNYVTEDVYRNNLYMEFRKLGYECVFTRYNHDTGLATFSLKDPEEPEVKYSYFRSGLPNTC